MGVQSSPFEEDCKRVWAVPDGPLKSDPDGGPYVVHIFPLRKATLPLHPLEESDFRV